MMAERLPATKVNRGRTGLAFQKQDIRSKAALTAVRPVSQGRPTVSAGAARSWIRAAASQMRPVRPAPSAVYMPLDR